MWAKLTTSITKKGDRKMIKPQKSLNVNEEYLCAVRTKSYAEFLVKFQLLVNEPSPVSSSSSPPEANHSHLAGFSETLLEPGQETIASILQSSSSHGLKSLLSNYFDVSAEASSFCSNLLKTLTELQSDYRLIHKIIEAIDEDDNEKQFSRAFSEIRSRVILNNPFTDYLNWQGSFHRIHDEHSSVLRRLKSSRKKASRKIKAIKVFNRASGVCATAACGILAAAAVLLATHTLTALLVGPAILALPIKPLRKEVRRFGREGLMKSGSLGKTVEQLDVAAKGAYILNRDFDTMSRLVGRLGDEIEHNKSMIRLCLDRREDKLSFQVLKEIKKCEFGFKKQVDELEEHVCLCLVTINRARAMLVTQISKDDC